MKDIKISKAWVDKLWGRFLKDGADILAKPVSALSIFWGFFTNALKVAKLKPIFKNEKNTNPSN